MTKLDINESHVAALLQNFDYKNDITWQQDYKEIWHAISQFHRTKDNQS